MKILLGMPTVGNIPMQTVTSLLAITRAFDDVYPMLVENSLVYVARDMICDFAIRGGFDYVLFVDSDMVFTPNDLKMLLEEQRMMVSGSYVRRYGDPRLVAYKRVDRRTRIGDSKTVDADMYGAELEEVAAVGMGFCLIKVELLIKMSRDHRSWFEPRWGLGEDIAFCERVKNYDKVYLSRKVKIGHIGKQVNNVPCEPLERENGH